jgi:hypothetical protein
MLITAPSWNELLRSVKAHRRANVLPIGLNIEQEIADQLCSVLPPGSCFEDIGAVKIIKSLSFKDVVTATKTLASWVVNGMERVTLDEANRRVRICSGCPYNQRIQGCGSCAANAVRAAIVEFVGKQKLEGENLVDACAVCGCSLKALVWLPIEAINRHEPQDILDKLPAHCWHKP